MWKYHRSDKGKFSDMVNLYMIIPEVYMYHCIVLSEKSCDRASTINSILAWKKVKSQWKAQNHVGLASKDERFVLMNC